MPEVLPIEDILPKISKRNERGKLLIRNRIYRVGVELEGGWKEVPEGVEIIRDGSVSGLVLEADNSQRPPRPRQPDPAAFSTTAGYNSAVRAWQVVDMEWINKYGRQKQLAVGEYPSEILEPKEVQAWMTKNYPSHVNATCGMHVHMSFLKALHYSKLMIPEYPQTIVVYMAKWALEEKLPKDHPLWDRLKGKNQYCKLEFFPDEQSKQSKKVYDHSMKGHRYTVINYCHAKTGTIECRLLPMMEKADQGVRAVQRILDVTNACLYALKDRETKLTTGVKIDAALDEIDESKQIYV